mmetsp:Transcript_38895/g.90479  ORF Transcript_38895/g.90479 Transcript_38895/m.90479 type:complete len:93 (+) Transcript_38895:203-481(+)
MNTSLNSFTQSCKCTIHHKTTQNKNHFSIANDKSSLADIFLPPNAEQISLFAEFFWPPNIDNITQVALLPTPPSIEEDGLRALFLVPQNREE